MAVKQLQDYPLDVVGLGLATGRAKNLSDQFGYAWVLRRYTKYIVFVGNREIEAPRIQPNCPDIEVKARFYKGNLQIK